MPRTSGMTSKTSLPLYTSGEFSNFRERPISREWNSLPAVCQRPQGWILVETGRGESRGLYPPVGCDLDGLFRVGHINRIISIVVPATVGLFDLFSGHPSKALPVRLTGPTVIKCRTVFRDFAPGGVLTGCQSQYPSRESKRQASHGRSETLIVEGQGTR